MSSHFTRRYLTAAAIIAATVPALLFAKAAANEPDRVVFIAGDTTRAAFAKGQPLVETANYKVHASRRDAQGRLTINEHGHRRVSRLEPDGQITVLADHYQGRRLNSASTCFATVSCD